MLKTSNHVFHIYDYNVKTLEKIHCFQSEESFWSVLAKIVAKVKEKTVSIQLLRVFLL